MIVFHKARALYNLKKYKDSELVKRVLKMTYCKVDYNYGIGKTTLQKISILDEMFTNNLNIISALDFLENYSFIKNTKYSMNF